MLNRENILFWVYLYNCTTFDFEVEQKMIFAYLLYEADKLGKLGASSNVIWMQQVLTFGSRGGNLKFFHVVLEIFSEHCYIKFIKADKSRGRVIKIKKKKYFINWCDEFQLLKYECEFGWLILCQNHPKWILTNLRIPALCP